MSESKSIAKYDGIKNFLSSQSIKNSLMQALPAGTPPDRLIRSAMNAMLKDPLLLECTKASWARALLEVAMLGLEVNVMGSTYLIPFRNKEKGVYEVTMIPGYRGLITLATRSGAVKAIIARIVHERDHFELAYSDVDKIFHKPFLTGDPGEMIGAYMRATLPNDDIQIEYMSKPEIDLIRGRSKAGGNGPWMTDYEEMARKTPVRRGIKYLSIDPAHCPQLARALDIEDRFESGETALPIDLEMTDEAINDIESDISKPDLKDPPTRTEEALLMMKEKVEKPASAAETKTAKRAE